MELYHQIKRYILLFVGLVFLTIVLQAFHPYFHQFPLKNLVLGEVFLLLLPAVLLTIFWPFIVAGRRNAHIRKVGVNASATITDIRDLFISINENPQAELTLQVSPAGMASYEAKVSTFVSRVDLPRVGDKLTVLYDPAHPTDVTLA